MRDSAVRTLEHQLRRDPSRWDCRALLAEIYRAAGDAEAGGQILQLGRLAGPGCAAELGGVISIRTAAQHARSTAFWTTWIFNRLPAALLIFLLIEPVRAPFPHIADHIRAVIGAVPLR